MINADISLTLHEYKIKQKYREFIYRESACFQILNYYDSFSPLISEVIGSRRDYSALVVTIRLLS